MEGPVVVVVVVVVVVIVIVVEVIIVKVIVVVIVVAVVVAVVAVVVVVVVAAILIVVVVPVSRKKRWGWSSPTALVRFIRSLLKTFTFSEKAPSSLECRPKFTRAMSSLDCLDFMIHRSPL